MKRKDPANTDVQRERQLIENGVRDHLALNRPDVLSGGVEIDISPCGMFVSVRKKELDKPS